MKPFVLLSDDGDFHVYPARLVPPIEKHLTKIEHARGEKYPDLPLILNEEPFYSLLPYFLSKYIDRSLTPFYRDLVVFGDGFEYYDSNLYTYKSLCQMFDEIKTVSQSILAEEMTDTVRSIVSEINPQLLLGFSPALPTPEEIIRLYKHEIVQYYSEFCTAIRELMESTPEYDLLDFWGP